MSPSTPRPARSRFTVLPGGRRATARCAGVYVVAAVEEDPPFPVDAVAYEEDTWLALSADPRVVRAPGHPVRVMTRVWEAHPERPGAVVVRRGPPLRLLAVVHDLDARPTWREEWVEAALDALLSLACEHHLRAIALPLLGTRHGDMEPQRFMRLLGRSLERMAAARTDGAGLQRIWLVRTSESGTGLVSMLTGDAG